MSVKSGRKITKWLIFRFIEESDLLIIFNSDNLLNSESCFDSRFKKNDIGVWGQDRTHLFHPPPPSI